MEVDMAVGWVAKQVTSSTDGSVQTTLILWKDGRVTWDEIKLFERGRAPVVITPQKPTGPYS